MADIVTCNAMRCNAQPLPTWEGSTLEAVLAAREFKRGVLHLFHDGPAPVVELPDWEQDLEKTKLTFSSVNDYHRGHR